MDFPELPGAPIAIRSWIDQLSIYGRDLENRIDFLATSVTQLTEKLNSLQVSLDAVQTQTQSANQPTTIQTASSAVTLSSSDFNQVHVINATANITLNLPTALEGTFLKIYNVGTGRITVTDSSTSNNLCELDTNQGCEIRTVINSSGTPLYPTRCHVTGLDGLTIFNSQIVFDNDTSAMYIKDSSGHYWKFNISTGGAMNSSDDGTIRAVLRESSTFPE